MKSIRNLFVMVVAISLVGCEESESKKANASKEGAAGKSSSSSSGFLTAGDMAKPSKVALLTEEAMINLLNGTDEIYNQSPTDDDKDECQKFIGSKAVKATKNTLVFEHQFSLDNCIDKEMMKSASMRILMTLECTDSDFSPFNGKSLDSLPDHPGDVCKDGEGRSLFQSEINAKVEMDADGQLAKYNFRRLATSMTSSGSPCVSVITGDSFVRGECFDIVKTTYSNVEVDGKPSTLDSDYEQLSSKGIRGKRKATYFSSGNIEMTFNNWTGSLTYNGSEKAPTWKMSDGSNSSKGTFSGSSLLLRKTGAELEKRVIKYNRFQR